MLATRRELVRLEFAGSRIEQALVSGRTFCFNNARASNAMKSRTRKTLSSSPVTSSMDSWADTTHFAAVTWKRVTTKKRRKKGNAFHGNEVSSGKMLLAWSKSNCVQVKGELRVQMEDKNIVNIISFYLFSKKSRNERFDIFISSEIWQTNSNTAVV